MKQWQLRLVLGCLHGRGELSRDLGLEGVDAALEAEGLGAELAEADLTLLDPALLAGQGDQRGGGLVGGDDLADVAAEHEAVGVVGPDEAPLAAVVLGLEVTELPGLADGGLGGLGVVSVFGVCHE